MTCVILCGGFATRLRHITANCPKALLPIGDKPFLWYMLHALKRQGATHIVLSTGHLGAMIADYVGDGHQWQLTIQCIQERQPLGTGGAVSLAAATLGLLEPILVLNGDTFFSGSLRRLIAAHRARPDATGTMALVRVKDAGRYGRVDVDARSGLVRRFDEKLADDKRPAWINAGIYMLEPALIASIRADQMVSLERDVFPSWLGQGLYGCCYEEAEFLDFGTPEDYARASTIVHHWTTGA